MLNADNTSEPTMNTLPGLVFLSVFLSLSLPLSLSSSHQCVCIFTTRAPTATARSRSRAKVEAGDTTRDGWDGWDEIMRWNGMNNAVERASEPYGRRRLFFVFIFLVFDIWQLAAFFSFCISLTDEGGSVSACDASGAMDAHTNMQMLNVRCCCLNYSFSWGVCELPHFVEARA